MHCADRLEEKLGFEGQPRAVAFHHSPDGETHMHIAWSRIDTENMRAIDPGLYKNKLKEISRELEQELDLVRVSSERENIARAPDRNEFEEARRLGTDVREIRDTIRDCLDRSDNGQSFKAAIEQEGMMLANGDRRDCFVVIDQEGGHHALKKSLTGMTLAQTRARLADLDREQLPTVEQAREQQIERSLERAEKTLEQTVERTAPEPEREEKPLGRMAGEIHLAYTLSDSAQGFAEALQERGLRLSRASAQDIDHNEQMRAGYQQYVADHPEEAKTYGIKEPPRLREGELVIVALYQNEPSLYFLNERTTGDERGEIAKYLSTLNPGNLPDIQGAAHDLRESAERQAKIRAQQNELGKTAGEIRLAYTLSQSGQEFVDGLEQRGFRLARVTLSDVQQNAFAREFCAEHGKRIPAELQLDELVAVNRYGAVFFLNERTTGDSHEEVTQYLGRVTRDLPSMYQVHQEFMRQAEFIPDPELHKKYDDELLNRLHAEKLRELRTELMVERRELREQLANDELLPSERAALQERDAEAREQQAQIRHALREMYVTTPSRFSPEAREMSRETPLEGLAGSVRDAVHEAVDLAAGLADMAGKAVEFVTDFFITPSAPTPEMIHARREAREEAAEAQQVKAKTNEQDDRQRQIDETVRQMKEREEQYKRLRENDLGRERER
jgi:Relaxase/Mobilisation nuclease domain